MPSLQGRIGPHYNQKEYTAGKRRLLLTIRTTRATLPKPPGKLNRDRNQEQGQHIRRGKQDNPGGDPLALALQENGLINNPAAHPTSTLETNNQGRKLRTYRFIGLSFGRIKIVDQSAYGQHRNQAITTPEEA